MESQSQHELESRIRLGGGKKNIARQHEKGRLTARERVDKLIDPDTCFFEIGLWAAWGMYEQWGGAPAAGLVCGVARVSGVRHMIIANDATVKAGSFFPMTVKKMLRAQHIAMIARIPLIYLVDSAGVFLPLQDEIFPDQDDFGRIFRNNAVISAMGIPQTAAIMGSCVAGGAYLPVMCDRILMTEGSGLYIAGPSLVKAAIGQDIDSDRLGGAKLHASLSGTVDFREEDEPSCLEKLRRLAAASGAPRSLVYERGVEGARPVENERKPDGAVFDAIDAGTIEFTVVLDEPVLLIGLKPGFSRRIDLHSARRALERARNEKTILLLDCSFDPQYAEDLAAFSSFSLHIAQLDLVTLVHLQNCENRTIVQLARSVRPALVVSPYSEAGIQAARSLWIDVLYAPENFPAVLKEGLQLLREQAGQ